MTRPNITPGPWTDQGDNRINSVHTSICGIPRRINTAGEWEATKPEVNANAQAITAIPELLAVLELARDTLKENLLYLVGDPAHECAEVLWAMELTLVKAGYTP